MQNNHRSLIWLSLFLVFSGTIQARTSFSNRDEGESVRFLQDGWEFRAEEDSWVSSPYLFWNRILAYRYFKGTGSFRYTLDLPDPDRLSGYGFYFPVQYNYSRVFLNGVELTPLPFDYNGVHDNYVLSVDRSLWRQGANEILIEQNGFSGYGGFRSESILFGPVLLLLQKTHLHLLRYGGLTVVLLFLFIFSLLRYAFHRSDFFYLFYSLLSLVMGMWIAGFFGIAYQFLHGPGVEVFFSLAAGILVFPLFAAFLNSFLFQKIGKISLFILSPFPFFLFWLISEFAILGDVTYFNYYIYNIFLVAGFFVILYALISNIFAIKNKVPWSGLLLPGTLLFAGGTFQTILLAAGFLSEGAPLLGEGYFGMVMFFSILLSRRSALFRRDLNQARQDLQDLDRMKDQFLSNISHELRTPLNGIVGIAQSMLDGASGEISEYQRFNLGLIAGSGRRLTNLVNDILDYETLKKRDLKLKTQKVDLAALTDLVLTILKQIGGFPDIEVENAIVDLPLIEADESRIQQVLYNLIGNAVKFTKSGRVTISGKKIHTGMIQVDVRDTGPGIGPEKMNSLFNEFEPGDGVANRSHGGAGLGLAITRKLVELHGGKVFAESIPGKGSIFSFTLPEKQKGRDSQNMITAGKIPFLNAVRDMQSTIVTEKQQPIESVGEGKGKRILIVDDDHLHLQVMINYLSNEGHEVLSCNNGGQGIQMIEMDTNLDLVVLDLMMPEVTGYQVLEAIRRKYSFYDLPVIILTSRNLEDEIVSFLKKGANDYIAKPFLKSEFIARVHSLLTLKSSVRSHRELLLQEKEMDLAREVQESILTPRKYLESLKGFECSVYYLPANGIVGGDYYNIQQNQEKELSVILADAAGHGFQAALTSMQVDMMNRLNSGLTPGEKLNQFNEVFYGKIKSHILFTCFVAEFSNSSLSFASAGHPLPLLYSKKKRQVLSLQSSGIPIGVSESPEYQSYREEVDSGDVLILYTDGIIEAVDQSGVFFGEERLFGLVEQYFVTEKKSDLDIFIRLIVKELNDWVGKEVHYDDISLLVLRIL